MPNKRVSKNKVILFIMAFMSLVFSVCFLSSSLSSAQVMDEMGKQLQTAAEQGAGYAKPQDPRTSASLIIRSLLGLIGTVMLVLIIYAGFLYMTAAGNEDRIDKAKKIITSAVIGLVIVLLAYSITYFLTYTALGGKKNIIPSVPVDEYSPTS